MDNEKNLEKKLNDIIDDISRTVEFVLQNTKERLEKGDDYPENIADDMIDSLESTLDGAKINVDCLPRNCQHGNCGQCPGCFRRFDFDLTNGMLKIQEGGE